MMKNSLSLIALLLLLAGCAGPAGKIDLSEVEPVAPLVQSPPPPRSPGSLWTDREGGIFYDNKGTTVGDIVTVAIFEKASASKEATTETDRSSSMTAGITALFGLEKNISNINGTIDPATLIDATAQNEFSGFGKTERKENLVATLTTQIIEVLPNGNLRLEGNKTVTVNNEMQIVKLSGIVRPTDVSPSNIVSSQNILNARIAYVGEGVISDKQQQGWLVRGLDQIWPF